MVRPNFVSVGLLALCMVLATAPQHAQADIIQDATKAGANAFDAAFDSWSE